MSDSRDPVIVAMTRSPIGSFGGVLAPVRAHDLAAQLMVALMKQSGVEPALIDDVVLGDCVQCADEASTARTALLKAGLPIEVPGVSIQRQCASGMQAMAYAAAEIMAGQSDLVLAGGVESMSNAPYQIPKARWGARLMHQTMSDSLWDILHSGSPLVDPPGYIMGRTAENLAVRFSISREEQDQLALESHQKASKAQADGRFAQEITPIKVRERKGEKIVKDDEHIRHGLTMEALAKLKPAFDPKGSVTAGNASGINDGAAICLLASRRKAKELGLEPLARIRGWAVRGCEPSEMGYGPVPATRRLMKRGGWSIKDFQLIELNEAFAAQYLVCERELDLDRSITNRYGSGIALGHPIGATGARISQTLVHQMRRNGLNLGLATLCIGGGMGMAMVFETE